MSEFLLFAVAFLAEVLGTMAGFGSSTIFLPLALFFVDFPTALVLTAFFHVFGSLGRLTFFRHGFDRRLVLYFGVPSVLLTLLGALLVPHVSQDLLKMTLGLFLIAFSLASILRPNFAFPATRESAVVGGGLSGFLAGLIGTGGALRGAFLTAFRLPKAVYIATAAAVALAVDLTRIPVYAASGLLRPEFYWFIPVLLVLAVAGSYVGKRIVTRIPQATFRRVVLGAIALVSLKFVYDGLVFLAVA